jgi:hypothetical protein
MLRQKNKRWTKDELNFISLNKKSMSKSELCSYFGITKEILNNTIQRYKLTRQKSLFYINPIIVNFKKTRIRNKEKNLQKMRKFLKISYYDLPEPEEKFTLKLGIGGY